MASFSTSASLYELFVRQMTERDGSSRSSSVDGSLAEQPVERRTRWGEEVPVVQGANVASAVANPPAPATTAPDQSHWQSQALVHGDVQVPDDLLMRGNVVGVLIGPKAWRLKEWKRQTGANVLVQGSNPYYPFEKAMFPGGPLRVVITAPSVGSRDACLRKVNEFFDWFRREPEVVRAQLNEIRLQQLEQPLNFPAALVAAEKVCPDCGSNKHDTWEGADAARSNASQLTTEAAEYLDALKQMSKEIPLIVGMFNTLKNSVAQSTDLDFLRRCVKVVRPKIESAVSAATSVAELGTRLNDMICDKWLEVLVPEEPRPVPVKEEVFVVEDEEEIGDEMELESTAAEEEEEEEIVPPPPPSLSAVAASSKAVSDKSKKVSIDEQSLKMLSRVVDLLSDQIMIDNLESIKQDSMKKKQQRQAAENGREDGAASSRHFEDVCDAYVQESTRRSTPSDLRHEKRTRQRSPSPPSPPRLRQDNLESRWSDWDEPRSSKRHRSSSRSRDHHKKRYSRSPKRSSSRHRHRRSSSREKRHSRRRSHGRSQSTSRRHHEESPQRASRRSPSPEVLKDTRRSSDKHDKSKDLVPLPPSRWDDDDDDVVESPRVSSRDGSWYQHRF